MKHMKMKAGASHKKHMSKMENRPTVGSQRRKRPVVAPQGRPSFGAAGRVRAHSQRMAKGKR